MIDNIITALKQRCASFGPENQRRIAGAAEFVLLNESTKMVLPAAYVVPLDDEVSAQEASSGYRQTIRDVFAVIVVVSNVPNERGQTSVEQARALRPELWRALLAWKPDANHDRIEYEGAQLLDVNRSHLYYQYEFGADIQISQEDTWQEIALNALPPFEELNVQVDAINPHDPNRAPSGPDGTLEATAEIPLPQ